MTRHDIFRALLTMSFSGALLAGILLACKPLLRNRLTKRALRALWLVVLAAWLVPLSGIVPLPRALANVPSIHAALTEHLVSTAEISARVQPYEVTDADGFIGIAPEYQDEVDALVPEPWVPGAVDFLMFFCSFGTILSLSVTLARYAVFIRTLKAKNKSVSAAEQALFRTVCTSGRAPRLYRNSAAATPMLLGVLHPMILLPERTYSDEQLRAVLQHELTHWRRGDVAVKWLAALAVSLHWFNPLVHLMRREIDHACELACDEAVIQPLNRAETQLYGDTLIEMAAEHAQSKTILSTTMCEEARTLKARLSAILHPTRSTRVRRILTAALLAIFLCGALLLGASARWGSAAEFFLAAYQEGSDGVCPAQILSEQPLSDGGTLLLYSNRRAQFACAILEETLFGYRVIHTSAELSSAGAAPAAMISSRYQGGEKWLAWGILRDAALTRAAFSDTPLTLVKTPQARFCYLTGEGDIPEAQFLFFDAAERLVWDCAPHLYSKAMTLYLRREQGRVSYALLDGEALSLSEETRKRDAAVFSTIAALNDALAAAAQEEMRLYIRHDPEEFTKEEVDALTAQLEFPLSNHSTSTGALLVS